MRFLNFCTNLARFSDWLDKQWWWHWWVNILMLFGVWKLFELAEWANHR